MIRQVPFTRTEWLMQKINFLLEAAKQVFAEVDIVHVGFTVRVENRKGEDYWAASSYVNPECEAIEPQKLALELARQYRTHTIAALGISIDTCTAAIKPPKSNEARFAWLGKTSAKIWGEDRLESDELSGDRNWARIKSSRQGCAAYTEISINRLGIVTITLGFDIPL